MKARRNTRKRGGEQSRVSRGDRSAHVTRALLTHAGGKEPPLTGMDFHGESGEERSSGTLGGCSTHPPISPDQPFTSFPHPSL